MILWSAVKSLDLILRATPFSALAESRGVSRFGFFFLWPGVGVGFQGSVVPCLAKLRVGQGVCGGAPAVWAQFPVWVAPCEPTQGARILPRGLSCSPGPPLAKENQFFSPVSTYPESCVHISVVTGECPCPSCHPCPQPRSHPQQLHVCLCSPWEPHSHSRLESWSNPGAPRLLFWDRGIGWGRSIDRGL